VDRLATGISSLVLGVLALVYALTKLGDLGGYVLPGSVGFRKVFTGAIGMILVVIGFILILNS
jgi:hypothetical protein